MADGRTDFPLPAGERLRQARLTRNMSLDDVATQTRVPTRHLEAIERGDWSDLPAPTYTIGFAKAYADLVGLDRQEIGDSLRTEIGGSRQAPVAEVFQPADPARVPPRMLAALAAIVAIGLGIYGYSRTSASGEVEPQIVAPVEAPAARPGAASAPVAAATGPVVITANDEVWLQVYERGGKTLKIGTLAAGQSYQVPADAADPLLRTGRADLLRVAVGTADAPPVGPANQLVKDISLRPEALMARGAPAAAAAPRQP